MKLLIVLGLGLVILAAWLARREHAWLRSARVVPGTVAELIPVRGSKGLPRGGPGSAAHSHLRPTLRLRGVPGGLGGVLHPVGGNVPGGPPVRAADVPGRTPGGCLGTGMVRMAEGGSLPPMADCIGGAA